MKVEIMKNIMVSLILSAFISITGFSQQYLERQFKGYINPDELITLSANLPFDQAIELLSKVSENMKGKRIVSTVQSIEPIGIEIENMQYEKALVVVVQYRGLIFEEKEDVVIVKKKGEKIDNRTAETYVPVDSREVKISAVFFEMDVNEARKRGIDWKLIFEGKGLDLGGLLGVDKTKNESQGSTVQQPSFDLGVATDFTIGNFFGEATAIFKFFETENMGEVIASPNVVVRDGRPGRIQVGQDIAIKQRDFAGNVIENFFSTGTIITVTPHVINEEGVDYTLLKIAAERSSYIPDPSILIVNKTVASTEVLMLNGEETIIGGLFINDEVKIRAGVPILKDLPWYVLGLRYIFGTDEIRVAKKELVILLKLELVPTLKERLAGVPSTTLLQDEVKRHQQKVKMYKFHQQELRDN
jgi:type IV pilus assembly protein PilQ